LAALYCDFSWANPGTLFDLILSPLVTDLYNDLNIQVRSLPRAHQQLHFLVQ
jgi:hypothetical protein